MSHHPVLCILPPHMLDKLAQNGSQEQKDFAVQTLRQSEQLRGLRQAAVDMPFILRFPRAEGVVAAVKQRTVYDANHTTTLPGTVVRREGDPPSADVAVNEAYDGAGNTFDFYNDIYQRNSIDGNGMAIISSVHYDINYDNAFWDGSQMVYGDGDSSLPPDKQLFNRFTICLDVIGHELTHGVTQFTAQLAYNGQSGALNESMSDVFGILVKQRALGLSAAQSDWIIGAGLFTANVHGVGIRSMKAPGTAYDDPVLGKDPQPDNMANYVNTPSDNGGVHINSGIPNHAFYVTSVNMGGNAWEKAGLIWYTALTTKLSATSDFQAAANATFTVAGDKFGVGGAEQLAVKQGWAEVGINAEATSTNNKTCLQQILEMVGAAPKT